MKAILIDEPGPPSALYVGEAERPELGEKEILVRIEESYADELKDMEVFFTEGDGELDVILDKVEGKTNKEICEDKAIFWDQVIGVEDL